MIHSTAIKAGEIAATSERLANHNRVASTIDRNDEVNKFQREYFITGLDKGQKLPIEKGVSHVYKFERVKRGSNDCKAQLEEL